MPLPYNLLLNPSRPVVCALSDVRGTRKGSRPLLYSPLFLKNHFECSYLFRDQITIKAFFPATPAGEWKIEYQFASQRGEAPKLALTHDSDDEELVFEIPIEQPNPPGIKAKLRVITTFWNL